MSDWRQIQARIRKARTSADPPGQLAALYERTRDAMVAFELAQIHEKSGDNAEAARWYTAAAQRFRRAQWKKKAEESLARLGAPAPASPVAAILTENGAEPIAEPVTQSEPAAAETFAEQSFEIVVEPYGAEQSPLVDEPVAASQELAPELPTTETTPPQAAGDAQGRHRKRRGRRGGRGRHKGQRANALSAATPAPAPVSAPVPEPAAEPRPEPIVTPYFSEQIPERRPREPEPVSTFEPVAPASSLHMRTRPGDPALSSRMTKLESQLRRLLACAAHAVERSEEAPAGPGVFLIADTDQTSYYYVEACQTLRVGIGNLVRGGRGSREASNLKAKLADHLGISEARVGKYLKEQCAVRWLQLDDGAPLLAHFAVAVLRPVAND